MEPEDRHGPLLDMYVFDYLKRRGFTHSALNFIRECKGLKLVEIADADPKMETGAAPAAHGDAPTSAGGDATEAATRALHKQLPSVILPTTSKHGFLSEWWAVFWDVHANVSGHRTAATVPEGVRVYVHNSSPNHQPRTAAVAHTVNANGKRVAPP
ncbi:hypothetical protein IWQ56_001240 [Coemansia nantahalensis]|uniref:Uncharacterized protein n=1 Tax=Coemansia nantahalensis TaxID=2789366 RepID=A0ACC1K7G8_9FUNG|nr:hypothetical protein IWQ56_001240 [Coemansia nantahalensis]KAJ2774887.1 hypothetical protein IWQ57_000621 [Coemansia nantahalensis]